MGIAAQMTVFQIADAVNNVVLLPLVDLLSLPDTVLKCVFDLTDDDLLALSAQFPGGYDDIFLGVVVGGGKAPIVVRRVLGYKKAENTLDLLKKAERTNSGALKVDASTLQEIGKAEARGGKAFSGIQEQIVQSKPATWQGELTGGQQTVIKYVDPSTGQTKFTVHTVTDSNGNVVHRDFDSVLLESGQQVVK